MCIVVAVAAVFLGLPLYTQTSNYPVAIVQGNSMYPRLHNGDLVVFTKAPSGVIPNGTIIVFVQGDTGVSSLDSLVRPVVIHRIVGVVVQADGTVYYRTKGDNNAYPDPSLAEANHVLGVPLAVVPSLGLLVLFGSSPQGLIAIIGMITLYYLGGYEVRMKVEERKDRFLGDMTNLLLEGELSHETFQLLEPVVKYGKNIRLDGSADDLVLSLLNWIKKGGLDKKWRVNKIDCARCSGRATSFVSSRDLVFTVCQNCVSARKPLVEPAILEAEAINRVGQKKV